MAGVHVPDRSEPAIIQNRGLLEAIAGMVRATGTIQLTGNPADGNIVALYGTTFEFDDDSSVTGGRTAVTIGSDAEESRDNLLTAIQALVVGTSDIGRVAAAASSTDTVAITDYQVGTAGNVAITKTGANITVVGMTGGLDGGLLNVSVSGIVFDPDIDIGDIHLLNIADAKINPSTSQIINEVIGATDTGVMMLAKHQSENAHLTTAEGDYDVPHISDYGALQTAPEQHFTFDPMNATTDWAVLNNDTINLLTTLKHVLGTNALTFDKTDGLANTKFGAIAKTLTTVDLGNPSPHDVIQTIIYVPDLTNVDYIFVRLGTDLNNYNEWRIDAENLTGATFETILFSIGDANHSGITGNGWNPSAINYITVGVAFDLETRDLAGIIFDEVSFHTNQHTSASFNAEVTTNVTSPTIRVAKVGNAAGGNWPKDAGSSNNATPRVIEADDSALTVAAKSAVHGGKTLLSVEITAANGDLTGGSDHATALIAASVGKRPYIVELSIDTDAQCQLVFTNGSDVKLVGLPQINVPAYGHRFFPRSHGYRFVGEVNKAVHLQDLLAGTVDVRGVIWYYLEA